MANPADTLEDLHLDLEEARAELAKATDPEDIRWCRQQIENIKEQIADLAVEVA